AFVSTKVAEMAIYAVFVFGVVLVALSDKAWKFSQLWLGLAMGLYIIGLGVAHGVLARGTKRMIVLQQELTASPAGGSGASGGPPPQVAEMDAISQRLAAAGAFNNVLLVVILFLMVWKPGM